MALSPYTIEGTTSTVYLDARRNAIKGYTVFVHLDAYDEAHEVNVPSLDSNVVKKAIEKLVSDRDKLVHLGTSAE